VKRTAGLGCAAILAAVAVGCGSGNGSGNTNDGGVPSGPAALSWNEDGTMHTALIAAAARVKSATLDMVQITGGESTGTGIAFGVSTPPPLVPGSYSCDASGTNGVITTLTYSSGNASSGVPTCTIEITSIGETTGTKVTGSFSAMVTLDNGMPKTLTDGTFNVSLTVSAL
jgi:hypothetical protein